MTTQGQNGPGSNYKGFDLSLFRVSEQELLHQVQFLVITRSYLKWIS